MGDGQNNLGETLIGTAPDFPQPAGDNGFYSPIYALYTEDPPASGAVGQYLAKTRKAIGIPAGFPFGPTTTPSPFMASDGNTARAIADVSLGGMSGTPYGASSKVGVPGSPIGPDAPITSAHAQTYAFGSGKYFTGTEGNSTIMYTIFRGSSEPGQLIGAYVFASSNVNGEPGQAHAYVEPDGDLTPSGDLGLVPYTVVHPASIGINTNNPSDNRPSNPSAQANMSEWYSYDHDALPLATTGYHASAALFTGDGGTSLYHYSKNISTDIADGDVVNLPSDYSFRFVLWHKQAASGGQPYQADVQLTNVKYNGVSYSMASPFPSNWSPGPETLWLTTYPSGPSPQRTTSYDPTPATTANAVTVANSVPSRAPVSTSGTSGKWNWQSDGEGPSTGTGVPDPTGAFFFESSGGTRRNEWSILESPEIPSITSDTLQFSMYRYGAGMGTAFMGIKIIN